MKKKLKEELKDKLDFNDEIQKDEKICPKSFMVLVLKMEVLTDSLELEVEEGLTEERPAKKKRASKNSPKKAQFIYCRQ